MGLADIRLSGYDGVVAVTQHAVNQSLAEYLAALDKQVALYYTVDSSGNLVPSTDPATAIFSFTGTLGYALDPAGHPVDIVSLWTGVPTKVTYNITFAAARFVSKATPAFDLSQQPGGTPWVIKFGVDLATVVTALETLPATTQQAVSAAVGDLPADAFSIQRLYVDLNTATYDTFQNIDGLGSYAEGVLAEIMRLYLAALQSSGGIIFGYALHSIPGPFPDPPPFVPTAVGFSITPFTDSSGAHSQPSLDTLNYLVMTNGDSLPTTPPTFGFNFVDDAGPQGAIVVRHDHYLEFLVEQLDAILTPLCPVCWVQADSSQNIDNQPMALNPGSPQSFALAQTTTNGVVATFSYSSPSASGSTSFFGGSASVSLDYSMTAQIAVSGSTVTISGVSTVSAESDTHISGGSGEESTLADVMPPTNYAWSVDLVLQMDPSANGRLMYAVQNANFDSPPTVTPENESAWQQFLDAVSGTFQSFVNDLGDIRESVQSSVTSQVLPALGKAINGPVAFAFPAGATFLFENPQLSNGDDLVANITYLTPGVSR